jgi:hypothetical protein
MGQLKDLTCAMGGNFSILKSILNKGRYVPKKKLRSIIQTQENILSEIEILPTSDISDFDEEIKFFIRVKNASGGASWTEEIAKDIQKVGEKIAFEHGNRIIENFNMTLKPHEEARELVEVYKTITYSKQVKLS